MENSGLSAEFLVILLIALAVLAIALVVVLSRAKRVMENKISIEYVAGKMMRFMPHFRRRVSFYETDEERARAERIVSCLSDFRDRVAQLTSRIPFARHPNDEVCELMSIYAFPFVIIGSQGLEEHEVAGPIRRYMIRDLTILNANKMRLDEGLFNATIDSLRRLADAIDEAGISLKPLGFTEVDLNGEFQSDGALIRAIAESSRRYNAAKRAKELRDAQAQQ